MSELFEIKWLKLALTSVVHVSKFLLMFIANLNVVRDVFIDFQYVILNAYSAFPDRQGTKLCGVHGVKYVHLKTCLPT